jgi:hypothetical protein
MPTVNAPRAPRHVLAPLQNWLARTAASRERFRDGQEFQIGWIWFRIGIDSRGVRVTAPRMGAPGLVYVDDCSDALEVLAEQQAILSRFGAEGTLCDCKQTMLVVRDLDDCAAPFMDRLTAPMDGRSGWYVGAHDSKLDVAKPENLKLVPSMALLSRLPELAPYLTLPVGWQVSFLDGPVVMHNRQVIEPRTGHVGFARAAS